MPLLLGKNDPPPFTVFNGRARSPVIIICDHASARVPESLSNLGLAPRDLKKHIGWDIGAKNMAVDLARALGAPAVLASYSRLVTDLNRAPAHPDCMRADSDHIAVPGNRKLSAAAKRARVKEIYTPYHAEIARRIEQVLARGEVPVVLSVHTFTPEMDGVARPWEVGVLWNREKALSRRLIETLRAQNKRLTVGDNQPYSMKNGPYMAGTLGLHTERRNIPSVLFEVRQDLVGTRAGAARWAKIMEKALRTALACDSVARRRVRR